MTTRVRTVGRTRAPKARDSPSRDRLLQRQWRNHPATKEALQVGKAICVTLRNFIAKSDAELVNALRAALRKKGFSNIDVEVRCGEIHAYIGTLRDRLHGHVIVPIRKAIVRYCRGYNMPHGRHNCCA